MCINVYTILINTVNIYSSCIGTSVLILLNYRNTSPYSKLREKPRQQ
jgi:hypothetical protein